MIANVIAMHRRNGKDTRSPELRHLAGEVSAVSLFDRDNDPPVFAGLVQSLSFESTRDSPFLPPLSAAGIPAARDHGHDSTSTSVKRQPASSEAKWPSDLMRTVSSSSTKPPVDDTQDSGIASRTNSYEHYSTDKPQNFSIPCSPVRKLENTLNSLDCSFGIEENKTFAADSKWIAFGEPFEETSGPSKHLEPRADAFASSFFLMDTPKKSGSASVVNALLQLEERLASLERIIHAMEHNTNTARVSDSTQSSPLDQAQDIAFVIEGTEMLQNKSVGEEIAQADCGDDKKSKFSVKRFMKSRFFGSKGTKPSLTKV